MFVLIRVYLFCFVQILDLNWQLLKLLHVGTGDAPVDGDVNVVDVLAYLIKLFFERVHAFILGDVNLRHTWFITTTAPTVDRNL